ncbi:DUF4747 family protein [Roseospira navarrensis]|uniref:DUF4747 family protein n=1 Tax=Roseospira navarrensis TaxID=140058 RepID=A0A7X1ZBP5_9PROT|nr:DUF4747 family protein [Roseospira navarrensis]MQX35594.1 DUF4747 family protein [Roseospira navarrensis]
MPNPITIEIGVLNVVSHPHSEDIYAELFEKVSQKEANYWGDSNAAIRKIRKRRDGFLQSSIVLGTEIDLRDPVVDRSDYTTSEASAEDARLSKTHLYNGRVFLFLFDPKTHRLYYERKNQHGKKLSPNLLRKALMRLFDNFNEEAGFIYEINVSIVPEKDTLDRLLAMPQIDSVEIHLERPNPSDGIDDEIHEIMEELDEQGLQKLQTDMKRSKESETIRINEKNMKRARVAQNNGFVKVSGRNKEGERFRGATSDYPLIREAEVEKGELSTTEILRVAKEVS